MNDSSQFDYSQHIFKEIKDIVYKKSGINLSGKYELVHARLLKRLHTIDLNSFPKYMQLVTTDESELMEMINAITTNVTHFFREQYQLETLANELCPIILEKKAASIFGQQVVLLVKNHIALPSPSRKKISHITFAHLI